MTVSVKEKMSYICDIFAGGDGGITYMKLRCILEDYEKTCATDDEAWEIITVLNRFYNLCKIAEKA